MNNKNTSLVLASALLLLGSGLTASADDYELAPPSLEVIQSQVAGDAEAVPNEDSTAVNIYGEIPDESACDCGIRVEARKAGTEPWIVLGFINPGTEGDAYSQSNWAIYGQYFELNRDYEVRARIFNREGRQSAYATKTFRMQGVPRADDCVPGAISGFQGTRIGASTNPLTILEWRPVCNAIEYRVYKNGQLAAQIKPDSFTYSEYSTAPGIEWKLEAYVADASGQTVTISRCEDVQSKLNSLFVSDTGTQVTSVPYCERIDNWIYASIEFGPWWNGYGGFQPPTGWLGSIRNGIRFGNRGTMPRVNYPDGNIPAPNGDPNYGIYNGFAECLINHPAGNTTVHPWNKTTWTCPQTSVLPPPYSPSGSAYTAVRAWTNFDVLKFLGTPLVGRITF